MDCLWCHEEIIMPIIDGVYVPLTLETALNRVIADAPASIVFSPGNPPELILANMFAQAAVYVDENEGELMALFMSPVGAMIAAMNPNNPRKTAIYASGYVTISNGTGADITVPINTVLTASNGSQYETTAAGVIPHGGSLNVPITALVSGISANIASGQTFAITGFGTLTATNVLPILNGAAAESDAIYLNRITSEKTEYGTQNSSISVETEVKKYYPDAYMYVNNTGVSLSDPIPVPANGYNLVVKTPGGILADSYEIAKILEILSSRLEFINVQNVGSTLHTVLSGSVLTSGVPLSYYFTVAQSVETTIAMQINIKASNNATEPELISQANSFATAFLNRLVEMFSGVDGTTAVTYNDGVHTPTVTNIDISGTEVQSGTIAPQFGIGTIEALVNDLSTMKDTPQILFDEVYSMTFTIDPNVGGESPVVLEIGGYTSFVDFKNDALFSDGTSFYDRFMYINPDNITITMSVSGWI